MSDFDADEYFRNVNAGLLDLSPSESITSFRSSREQELAIASAKKVAALQAVSEARTERLAENANSVVGKLGLDPEGATGSVVNHMVATVNDSVGLIGKAVAKPLEYLADSAENAVTPEQKAAYAAQKAGGNDSLSLSNLHEFIDPQTQKTILLNDYIGDRKVDRNEAIAQFLAHGDNGVIEKTPEVAATMAAEQAERAKTTEQGQSAGLDQRSIDRLEAAMKARDLAGSIKQATNLDELVAIDAETGERTSGLPRRVFGDTALKIGSGIMGAQESLLGLASLATQGDAGALAQEWGMDYPQAKKEFAELMTPEQRLADSKTRDAQGFSATLDAAIDNPSTITGGIAESIPSMWVGGKAGQLLTKAVPAIKAGIAGAVGEGVMMAGQQAENIRNQTDDKRLTLKQSLAAVGTGVMGAVVGVAGNKLAKALKVSDIDEVMVDGVGKAQRSAPTRTLLSGAVEGGEEVAQSAGEQVAQNVALDKQWDDGVGNAAAMGLVTGAPMGAASGLAEHGHVQQAVKEADEKAQVADFEDAVAKADPSPYLDPKTSNYAPDKAVAVLFEAARKDDTVEEVKQEHLAQAEGIVSDFQQQVQAAESAVHDATPEGLAQLKTELATAETDGNTPLVGALQQAIDHVEALTPAQKEQGERRLVKLQDQLKTATELTEQFNQLVSAKPVDHADVLATVEAAVTEPAAAQKVLTLAMHNPGALSQADLSAMVADESNGLSSEQRSYLKTFNEARLARNALQSVDSVHDEVLHGTSENLGLVQYQQQMGQALQQGNLRKASKLMASLEGFARSQQDKYRVFKRAYDQSRAEKSPVQVIRTDKGWEINTGAPLNDEDLKANTGKNIMAGKYSRGLVVNLQSEAKAIVATFKEFQAAQTVSQGAAERRSQALPPGQSRQLGANAPTQTTEQAPAEPSAATEQPAAAKTSTAEQVAELQDAPTQVTTAAAQGEESGELNVLAGDKPAKVNASNYRAVNLVRQFFTQSKDKQRPLVAVKDFMQQTVKSLKDFAPNQTLSVKQEQTLATFQQAAGLWNGLMDALLPKKTKADFSWENPIEFFMDENGQLEDNFKTAISVAIYSWVNDKGRDLVGSPMHITRLMNWDKDKRLNRAIFEAVGHLGTRESLVANDIGQTILKVLGLKSLDNAGVNERARLEAGIGQFAIAFMLDQKLIERQMITKGELVTLGAKLAENANLDELQLEKVKNDPTKVYFLRTLNGDDNVQAIIDAGTGSQGILDKVFGTERRPTEPSRTPPEFTQQTTQNTEQPIPQNMQDILNNLTKKVWRPVKERFDILKALPEELVNAMIGVKPVDEALVHADNRRGLQAKNDALLRGKQLAFDFLNQLASEEAGLEQDLYMEYSVWKHHRVGMTGSVLNPQTDKTHRFLVGMQEWATTIDPRSAEQSREFLLQVAAGLDIPVDKQGKVQSIVQVLNLLETDVMQAGMSAISQALQGHPLADHEQQAIADATALGKMNLHSFASLVEMVKFDLAKDQGTTFTSNLMGEVDGVTNGPMLSQILYGTITQENAEKGGFFAAGASATDYPTWRGQKGHTDFYETLATRLTENLKASYTFEDLHPIFMITGDLMVKVDRNIVKRPLTAVNYGSSMHAAIEGMADEFIDRLYKEIEKLAAKDDRALATEQLRDLLSAVSFLLKEQDQSGLNTQVSIEDAMGNVLSTLQESGLKKAFADTVGKAMETALEDTLGEFLQARDQFNAFGRTAFDLYNVVYQHMKESYVQQNLGGDIAEITQNGKTVPLHDLNAEQDRLIQKRLANMAPIMATAVSHRDGKVSDGVLLADSGKTLSDDHAYAGQLKLGRKVPDVPNAENPDPEKDRVSTMRFRGFLRSLTGPGVSSLVNGVQSTDSAIISQVYKLMSILNIHDAGGAGINQIGQMAEALNQSTFDNLVSYSPAAAMAETLQRVLEGLSLVMRDNRDTDLADKITAVLDKAGYSSTEFLLQDAVSFAASADLRKLDFLAQQEHVSQYGLADHSYSVTEADREKVAEARAKVRTELEGKVLYAVRTLDQTLELKEQEAQARWEAQHPKQWGELGTSSVASDPALVQFFTENPERTAGELFSQIEAGLGTDINGEYLRKLLKLLARTVNKDLKVTFINANAPFDGQDMTKLSGAAAWYSSERGIFIKSPQYKDSAVTPVALMHELVHATVAAETENPSNEQSQAMVKELTSLLNWVNGFLKGSPALAEQYKNAVSNVHELIAYGLTDKGFQDQVLKQVQVPNKASPTGFITAMKQFIDKVSGLLFKDSRLSQSEQALNGLSVLIHNASGLFAASQASQSTTELVLPMAVNNDPLAQIARMSTQELFDVLDPAPATFMGHLRKIQQTIADKLHGPFGVIKDAVMAEVALTPNDRFLQAIASGRLPYSSAAALSGVQMSAQESFVFEQVEAITLASIDNTGSTNVAYRELGKLYEEVKAKLTPADLGQDVWDYVFTLQRSANGKSDHLARFAAMGLAYAPMADKLKFATQRTERGLQGLSFWQAVQNIFERILETLHTRLTHTTPGQVADLKLMTLIEQLVGIEAKRRTAAAQPRNGFQDLFEVQTRKLNDAVRAGVQNMANSSFVKNNKLSPVRALGGVAKTVMGEERLGIFMDGMQRLRDQQFKQRPGMVMGLFNEVRGSHAGNLTAHELLRATNNNERLRKHLISDTNILILGGYANGGNDLTKADKEALTQGALRSDMQALLDMFSMDELEQLVNDPAKLQAAIQVQMGQLKKTGQYRYYLGASKDLAYFMATGLNRSPNLAKNSLAIAEMYGVRGRNVQNAKAAQKVIDPLVSLLAIQYTDQKIKDQLAQVMRAENARGNDSGFQLTLRMHKELQQQAKERVFDNAEGLMLKGYVPEVLNPHITLVAANEKDGKQLLRQGYSKSDKPLEQDVADPYAEPMHLYQLKDGGLKAYVTGIYSTTGMQAKGNTVHSGEFDMQGQTLHAQNQRHSALIERRKLAAVNAMLSRDESYDPRKVRGNHLAPVFNTSGDAVNYAYLMSHQTKNVALERNNDFSELLGRLAGSTFDKQASAEQNKLAVQAMRDQYLEEYARMPERYIKVGPTSPDKSLREAYRLLPKSTQQAIQDIWGSNTMLVRSDLADMYFGYRKFSITDMFKKQGKEGQDPAKEYRNAAENVFVDIFSYLMADRSIGAAPYQTADGRAVAEARAALRLRQAEDVWQEIISEIKDIVVVKSGLTLLGNVLSNFSELYWIGVPFKDMIKHHRVALRGVVAYRKDAKELFQLQNLLATGTIRGSQQAMEQRIIQLEDSIARSPVKELIDAGLLPTIVEDVAQETDEFSYKSKFAKDTEKYTAGLNKHIKTGARLLYVAHDTSLYRWLSEGTQISDFLARYTAYQHMTHREIAPMDHKGAVQFVADAFVNYDIPTHRSMQYLNDMGIIWFTKYYLRIQKVIMHLMRDNPARALMLGTIDHYFAGAQTLMDSGFIHHIGNPLSIGVLKYPGALEDLATIHAIMSPFKGQ